VTATAEQIAILEQIRTADNHDAGTWAEFVEKATGARVPDAELTMGQAEKLIALSNAAELRMAVAS
jgi:hypothetical protein